jgi:hypothetical protein
VWVLRGGGGGGGGRGGGGFGGGGGGGGSGCVRFGLAHVSGISCARRERLGVGEVSAGGSGGEAIASREGGAYLLTGNDLHLAALVLAANIVS